MLPTQKGGILVVGDLMVDRNWVLPNRSASVTSQSHGDVSPRKLINPGWQTDILGGAACVARAAFAAAPLGITVYLAGGWTAGFNPAEFYKENIGLNPKTDIHTGIDFRQVAVTKFNTEKLRIYELTSLKPKLVHRFDRDLSNIKEYTYHPVEWPPATDIGVVIVADFAKGLLDLPEIRDRLKEYAGKHFLLRAKRSLAHPVFELPWTVILPNRQDFASLASMERPVEHPAFRFNEEESRQFDDRRYDLNPGLSVPLKEMTSLEPRDGNSKCCLEMNRSILLKLDSEGALLYQQIPSGQKVTIFELTDKPAPLAGIGAGDVLAGNLAVNLLVDNQLPNACFNAIQKATAFCRGATEILHPQESDSMPGGGWFGVSNSISGDDSKKVGLLKGTVTESTLPVLAKSRNEHEALLKRIFKEKQICLRNAEWFLRSDFLTVDQELGKGILGLKAKIRKYLDTQQLNTKPFVVALCGTPGSGKSALAEALAKTFECEVLKENAAQWTSVDDLFRLCEQIRSSQLERRKPFAFIDEVDTDVAGQKLYGKLLAPFGDGAYFSYGYKRLLGPVVFLVAGSNEPWDSSDNLMNILRESGDISTNTRGKGARAETHQQKETQPKLRDLVSRLSTPPITVSALADRPADGLYLAVKLLCHKFPGVESIQKGVVELFAMSKVMHGPRSISQVVGMFNPLKDPRIVTVGDLSADNADLLLHLDHSPRRWREHKELIRIFQ